MEGSGWRQGSVVKKENILQFLVLAEKDSCYSEKVLLIVASGSCDIANIHDPIIEFSLARIIEKTDGNLTFNKNPRRLHSELVSDNEPYVYIELLAHEKIFIAKNKIAEGIEPDLGIQFIDRYLSFYVDWLASRYKRPAFPTEFDLRLDKAWSRKKQKRKAVKVSEKLLGIYAEVYPNKELDEAENYSVNLFALTLPEGDLTQDDKDSIEAFIAEYKAAFVEAKMDIGEVKIVDEFSVSVGTFKQYQRFNMDELSYKGDHPLPPDI